jgi:hypothetical protein
MVVTPWEMASPGEKGAKLLILFRMVVACPSSTTTPAAGSGAGNVKVAKLRRCLSVFKAFFNSMK